MPTYVYECTKGHTFETVQRITDKPYHTCRQASGKPCRAKCKRVIQPANFALKGGGWYKDGYSSSPSKPKGDK